MSSSSAQQSKWYAPILWKPRKMLLTWKVIWCQSQLLKNIFAKFLFAGSFCHRKYGVESCISLNMNLISVPSSIMPTKWNITIYHRTIWHHLALQFIHIYWTLWPTCNWPYGPEVANPAWLWDSQFLRYESNWDWGRSSQRRTCKCWKVLWTWCWTICQHLEWGWAVNSSLCLCRAGGEFCSIFNGGRLHYRNESNFCGANLYEDFTMYNHYAAGVVACI